MQAFSQTKLLIRKGKTYAALEDLRAIVRSEFPFMSKQVEVIIARAETVRSNQHHNLISQEAASVEISKINFSLLQMIEDLEKGKRPADLQFSNIPLLFRPVVSGGFILVVLFFFLSVTRSGQAAGTELIELKELKKLQMDQVVKEIEEEIAWVNTKLDDDAPAVTGRQKAGSTRQTPKEKEADAPNTNELVSSILEKTVNRVKSIKSDYDKLNIQLLPAIKDHRAVLQNEIEKQIRFLPEKYKLGESVNELDLIRDRVPTLAQKVVALKSLVLYCSHHYLEMENVREQVENYVFLDALLHERTAGLSSVDKCFLSPETADNKPRP